MKSGRFFVLALFVLVSPVRGSGSETAPFVVEVIDHVEEALIGLPVVCNVRVRNVSGKGQTIVGMELVQRFESWPEDVREGDLPGHYHWDSPSELPRVFFKPESGFEVPPAWFQTKRRIFRLPSPGRYSFRYVIQMGPTGERVKKMFDAPEEHWIGEVSSELIVVIVKEPQGLDVEAFQAVCALAPEKLVKKLPPAECYRTGPWRIGKSTGARRLLLTKYLESTYASYEIFKQYGNRWTGDADYYQRWATPSNLSRIRDYGWCDASGDPNSGARHSEKLAGEEFLRCRDQWLRIALENHPDIWFADEIRMVLSGDAYLLGDDKGRCRSLLEDLISKGRPSVAGKARTLLHDMIEKNMLPAPTPKPGFAEETTR